MLRAAGPRLPHSSSIRAIALQLRSMAPSASPPPPLCRAAPRSRVSLQDPAMSSRSPTLFALTLPRGPHALTLRRAARNPPGLGRFGGKATPGASILPGLLGVPCPSYPQNALAQPADRIGLGLCGQASSFEVSIGCTSARPDGKVPCRRVNTSRGDYLRLPSAERFGRPN